MLSWNVFLMTQNVNNKSISISQKVRRLDPFQWSKHRMNVFLDTPWFQLQTSFWFFFVKNSLLQNIPIAFQCDSFFHYEKLCIYVCIPWWLLLFLFYYFFYLIRFCAFLVYSLHIFFLHCLFYDLMNTYNICIDSFFLLYFRIGESIGCPHIIW